MQKEEIKELIRKIAPKNNPYTREISRAIPYIVLGVAIGAVLLHPWVGQPTTIKGKINVSNRNNNTNILYPEGEEIIDENKALSFSGEIEAWPRLREHVGETVVLKIIVIDAGTIKTKQPGVNHVDNP